MLIAGTLLAAVGMAAAGAWAARRSTAWATGAGAFLLAAILAKAVVGHIPAAEAALFPWDWYPRVEPGWYLIPALFLVGAGLGRGGPSTARRGALLAAALVLLARAGAAAWVTAHPPALAGTVNQKGVCLQTSDFSCGAAAAASFVYYYGVRATEQEMAELCVTRGGGAGLAGTSDAGLRRGLRRKLAGRYDVLVGRTTYEDLSIPALVPLELYPGVGHCVMVVRVDRELVHLIDPRYGRGTLSRAAFERQWTGAAIWAEHQ